MQRPIKLYKELISYVDKHSNPNAWLFVERSYTIIYPDLKWFLCTIM